ncbi:hypothetical protein [Streptosporangium roseum]|uniref:Uncharacterized protein n=1 Tax=Streptosporangium roseum (strain ATCC 12428 / DSM 43021 / JCM 3005 / KCTC 9067 / NCIMB 10171 / NRRL 2505 / NI 9100) TaxID=479432 RepID=D2AS74_STRRD|nr:hypothetical protein [Streptosporangium roseum]ACZ86601.1 hypothetical protein Sros_3673 [Streptosporangium roseum DSM 43021]
MDAYERRCRLLMHAYPPRFREHRGQELLGPLLDLAAARQTRPALRDGFDIVRGGLLTRLRDRPPAGQWILYRMFGRLVSDRYRMWVRDDLRSKLYFFHTPFLRFMLIVPLLTGVDAFLRTKGVELLDWPIPVALGLAYRSAITTRRRASDRYGLAHVDAS